jgi:hypothetical protein
VTILSVQAGDSCRSVKPTPTYTPKSLAITFSFTTDTSRPECVGPNSAATTPNVATSLDSGFSTGAAVGIAVAVIAVVAIIVVVMFLLRKRIIPAFIAEKAGKDVAVRMGSVNEFSPPKADKSVQAQDKRGSTWTKSTRPT